MRKPRPALVILTGVAVVFVVLGLVAVRSVGSSSAVGGKLVSGELSLTPLEIQETTGIGTERAAPGRSFYIVRVRLGTQTTTSVHEFDPHQMLVRALDGGKAVRSNRGQRALGTDGRVVLTPGEGRVDEIAFEGARGIRRMSVRFNLLGGPGEMVSALFGGSPTVEVPVTP